MTGIIIGILLSILFGLMIILCMVAEDKDQDIENEYVKKILSLRKENEELTLMLYEMTKELENENNYKIHTTDNK